jgi:N-acetylglucosamine kinase-like BadF-type ATPase
MEGNLLGEGCSGPANIHLDLDLAKESVRAASRALYVLRVSTSAFFTARTRGWA